MNNKGNVIALGIKFMLGITIIIMILAIAPVIQQNNEDSMAADQLDCDNSSISDYDKLGCTSTDLGLFIFVGGVLLVGIGVFTLRRLNVI